MTHCSLAILVALALKRVTAMNKDIAVSLKDGKFGDVSNACNHAGGPLARLGLRRLYHLPWQNWKFIDVGGWRAWPRKGLRSSIPIKVENGRVIVNLGAGSKRHKTPHEPHPLSRKVERAPGSLRLAGISTTAMDAVNPRFLARTIYSITL